ncbi:MAG: PaaI family thioesterase [Pseudomonadota bacterium]
MPLKMSAEEIVAVIEREFEQVAGFYTIEALEEGRLTVRLKVGERHLRPGGTVSGPSIFELADIAVWMATMSMIGPQVMAVTTNAALDFMRKPVGGRDLLAECRLLKLGRVLAVGDVLIYSDGLEPPVARASLTYSIPPER